jgi:hypothetical protein
MKSGTSRGEVDQPIHSSDETEISGYSTPKLILFVLSVYRSSCNSNTHFFFALAPLTRLLFARGTHPHHPRFCIVLRCC